VELLKTAKEIKIPASPKPDIAAIDGLNWSRYQGHPPIHGSKSVDALCSSFTVTSQTTDSSRSNLKYFTCYRK